MKIFGKQFRVAHCRSQEKGDGNYHAGNSNTGGMCRCNPLFGCFSRHGLPFPGEKGSLTSENPYLPPRFLKIHSAVSSARIRTNNHGELIRSEILVW